MTEIKINITVDPEFRAAQLTFNLTTSLEDVALAAVKKHHDSMMDMYTALKEARNGTKAQPEAQSSEATSGKNPGTTKRAARKKNSSKS